MTAYTYEHKYRLAQAFAKRFKDETRERAEKDTFWNEFFAIFKLDRYKTATTEYAVRHRKGSTKFADVFWAGRLLCEHKSAGKDLQAAYHQALEYVEEIRRHNPQDVPRHIIVSDFANIELHDLQEQTRIAFPLEDLPEQIKRRNFDFMDGYSHALKAAEEQANIDAAAAVGNLYAAFRKDSNYPETDLKQFVIRLLFCFFADDTLIFSKDQFADYLGKYTRPDGEDMGGTLNRIFSVLNTPPERRPGGMNQELKDFPYVNGKLFADSLCEFYFDAELRSLLFECTQRDWAHISPEIFGSLFQSVMESAERRELGAHYTEEANILKVINGLFMDELRERFQTAQKLPKAKRRDAMQVLHEHIGSLHFLDPACGCGNFLVVAYRELRKLEDDLIGEQFSEGQLLDISTMQRCHIGQFHGIEIDEYPAQIAKVAMWLTDHQCNLRTAERFGQTRPSIPLTDSAEIVNANALRNDWPQADYIFGNPPFIGAKFQNAEQKADMKTICGHIPGFGLLDYVTNWHIKAAGIMSARPQVQTAFVSTNSICQGEQVGVLWGYLLQQGFAIRFAHRTFQWTSQAAGKAAVHCIIVGFAQSAQLADKRALHLYPDIKGEPEKQLAENINPYLVDGPSAFLERRNKPLCDVPEMGIGNKPIDGGHYLFTTEEKTAFLAQEPASAPYFRRWLGAEEFLNGKERWCLWLGDASPAQLSALPESRKRVEAVRQFRAASKSAPTRAIADTPRRFHVEFMPESNFLVVPEVSSERRRFIPIGFLSPEVLASNLLRILPNATLYHFGILSSTMHNVWMRTIAGRLESRYRYSINIVYNNYPWPQTATEKHHAAIETAAKAVLDARALFADSTLAQLYNPDTMPTELAKAHQQLDKAVDAAYGYKGNKDDAARVAFLFELYQTLA